MREWGRSKELRKGLEEGLRQECCSDGVTSLTILMATSCPLLLLRAR